jgi:hypothetical protein
MLAVRAADWPLLTGGGHSEVAVRTGLTVDDMIKQYIDWRETLTLKGLKMSA